GRARAEGRLHLFLRPPRRGGYALIRGASDGAGGVRSHQLHPPHAEGEPAMSHDAILRDIAGKLPGKPNVLRRGAWIILMAVGLLAFAYLLVNEPRRAWGAYAASMIFFLRISLGAAVLAAPLPLAHRRLGGPIVRIAESLTAFLPYGIGFVVLMLAVGIWTYLPWTHHVLPRQAPYLNVPFLYARTLLGLVLLWWLIRDLVRVSLRTDAYL